MRAQVVYRQGLVKDFIASDQMTLFDFMSHANHFGKVRLLRSMRPVENLSTELAGGNVSVLPWRPTAKAQP